jgi:fibro-slime domain-containing protein
MQVRRLEPITSPGIVIWSNLVVGPVEERIALQVRCRKETNLIARLSQDLVLGGTLTLAVCLAGFGCAKVADQSGTGGSGGGLDAASGAGGGDDAAIDYVSPFDFGGFETPPVATCGNSVVDFGENCDDANNTAGDGCSDHCVTETGWKCPAVGKSCVRDVVCGDHFIEGTEACDDGNTTPGDGCAADCTLECGWVCPGGADCRAAMCGDGKVAGKEQCDDGNNVDGDGCSAICTLESKPAAVAEGWVCTSPTAAGADGGAGGCVGPTTCTTSVCGNGKPEGSEQCDDGNKVTGDGCSPFCRLEPKCPVAGGGCMNVCGSGLLLAGDGKDCDDGNTVDGDGCSSKCMHEKGFTCDTVPVSSNPVIIPVVYHDFQSYRDPNGHPDFEHYQGNGQMGITQATLGANGAPVHVPMCTNWTTNLCTPPVNATPTWDPATDWFGMWYVDTPAFNKTIVQTLSLGGQVNGVASATCSTAGQPACTSFQYSDDTFFPIDAAGWGNTPNQVHNYGFTSAARYWFQYTGAATLTFFGDDDVWVFINKQLAVDLGGTHQRAQGAVTLDASTGHGYVCDYVTPGKGGINGLLTACDTVAKTGGHDVDLGLKAGSIYEIAVFQAERFTVESHYQLTISKFSGSKSVCKGACGDGVVTAPEICDLGAAMNTGAYGGCNADCTLAPFCGDKKVQNPPEQCDGTPGCSADCKVIAVQ